MLKRLFAYGTLRSDIRGGYEHDGRVLCPGIIRGRMFNLGFPCVIPGNSEIHGQVLSFEHMPDEDWEAALQQFDRYEGTPRLFHRQQTEVLLPNGPSLTAWVYMFTDSKATKRLERIQSGDWKAYRRRSQWMSDQTAFTGTTENFTWEYTDNQQ